MYLHTYIFMFIFFAYIILVDTSCVYAHPEQLLATLYKGYVYIEPLGIIGTHLCNCRPGAATCLTGVWEYAVLPCGSKHGKCPWHRWRFRGPAYCSATASHLPKAPQEYAYIESNIA